MVSILVYGLKLEATKEGSSPSDALILRERCELKKCSQVVLFDIYRFT